MTRRFAIIALMFLPLVAASCGAGGPDLRATLDAVELITERSSANTLGVSGAGADGVWAASGEPAAVADAIAASEAPDERAEDAGAIYMLYRSGTVWVSPAVDGGSAVVLYDDNDDAYNRHSGVLIASRGWGTRVNDYRSSSSSGSGNGFRGGSSSSGK